MGISYKEVRNDRQWKATTGINGVEFSCLTSAFGQAYENLHAISLEAGAKNLKQELALPSYADCLYFVLFQLKTALSFDSLAVVFNMDGATAHRNFEKYLTVLQQALRQKNALPYRRFETVADFTKYLRSEPELIADVTEIRTERPADKEKQQERYSGKKKALR